jgi:Fe-S-cluster containining protein
MGEIRLPTPEGMKAPECAKGCYFCCHTIVVVTAPEAFYLADYIERTRTPEEFTRLVAHVRATDAKTRGLTGAQRWGGGPPCPMLDLGSGACSIYAGRPLPCRGTFSSSRASCIAAYENRAASPHFGREQKFLFSNADVYTQALAAGLGRAGRPLYRLELNAALTEIWTVENALDRWLAGEDIFVSARAPNATAPIA